MQWAIMADFLEETGLGLGLPDVGTTGKGRRMFPVERTWSSVPLHTRTRICAHVFEWTRG